MLVGICGGSCRRLPAIAQQLEKYERAVFVTILCDLATSI